MKKLSKAVFAIAMPVVFFSCKKDQDTTTLNVRLTDAPADYQAVNIDIRKVEAHIAGKKGDSWTEITSNPGTYNLLDLTNGIDAVIGSGIDVLTGRVTEVRLSLGPNNTIQVNDKTYSITIPSGSTSGLKIVVNKDLTSDNNQIVLDFDVAKSVKQVDSATYHLNPVIKVMSNYYTGVKGVFSPAQRALVYAISSSNDTASTYSKSDGNFLIRGLDKGNYTLVVSTASAQKTVSNIQVKDGQIDDAGTITLQ